MKNLIIFLFLFFGLYIVSAQKDSVITLQEAVVSDSRLLQFANGIKIAAINDSTLLNSIGPLTNVLLFNSSIYFKENGYGMVSSPSFRGTGASQTAVIWNGININSPLTGQTDFNTILPQNFDKISVRSGGGSTQYGTGAVGGSIHLENSLDFELPLENDLRVGYGSFATKNLQYKTKYGSDKIAINIGIGHINSDNDYQYLGIEKKNENGEFSFNSLDIGLGVLATTSNLIKLHHQTFVGDRNFSGTLTAPSNSKYKNLNTNSLLEWVHYKKKKVQRTKVAYLYEDYKYFANKDSETFSTGHAKTFLANYDLKYKLNGLVFNGLLDYSATTAEGTSIVPVTRNLVAITLLMSHKLTDKFSYGVNLRQDWVTDFNSPFVYALDGKYHATKRYTISLHTSKNFRIPTFNDLYWVTGGNPDLQPETSYQIELGQEYQTKGFKADLHSFFITNNDLIQWRPSSVSGVWSPINVKNAYQYGIESSISLQRKISNNLLNVIFTYAYTRAEDKESGYQLLYVPKNKLTGNFAYGFGRNKIAFQTLYNGLVYSTTDESQSVDAYFIGNLVLEHTIKNIFNTDATIAFTLNNIWNTNYQNVAFRPMPNRNFKLQLNFKF